MSPPSRGARGQRSKGFAARQNRPPKLKDTRIAMIPASDATRRLPVLMPSFDGQDTCRFELLPPLFHIGLGGKGTN